MYDACWDYYNAYSSGPVDKLLEAHRDYLYKSSGRGKDNYERFKEWLQAQDLRWPRDSAKMRCRREEFVDAEMLFETETYTRRKNQSNYYVPLFLDHIEDSADDIEVALELNYITLDPTDWAEVCKLPGKEGEQLKRFLIAQKLLPKIIETRQKDCDWVRWEEALGLCPNCLSALSTDDLLKPGEVEFLAGINCGACREDTSLRLAEATLTYIKRGPELGLKPTDLDNLHETSPRRHFERGEPYAICVAQFDFEGRTLAEVSEWLTEVSALEDITDVRAVSAAHLQKHEFRLYNESGPRSVETQVEVAGSLDEFGLLTALAMYRSSAFSWPTVEAVAALREAFVRAGLKEKGAPAIVYQPAYTADGHLFVPFLEKKTMSATKKNELPVADQTELSTAERTAEFPTGVPWSRKGKDDAAYRNLVVNVGACPERLLPDADIVDRSARWGSDALLRLIEEREAGRWWDHYNNHYREGDRPLFYKLLDQPTLDLLDTPEKRKLAEVVAATIAIWASGTVVGHAFCEKVAKSAAELKKALDPQTAERRKVMQAVGELPMPTDEEIKKEFNENDADKSKA